MITAVNVDKIMDDYSDRFDEEIGTAEGDYELKDIIAHLTENEIN
jgi:hypothetical protein